ncbi:ejaculatory bulb-specific protein 3-like [Leptidea sinapis]|uniref:ejaculatory bulb-specific protein 3-like n=1 Tax=Leptidea sinapis TaxID=189913 RepID=UPI00213FC780|nr:ejaculatory bulb-specific protein 3-like [Leptidea sinapis]
MKCIILLTALLALAGAETYSPENDDLDIEKVVNDLEVLRTFMNCFNDKGECDYVSADFKKDIPEAVREACAKCTTAQKHIFKRFLEVSKEKTKTEYSTFVAKYDPEGKFIEPLTAAIANF